MAYLTRGERERFHICSYFAPVLREWAADERNTLTKEQKRRLRMAASLIDNSLVQFVEKLEPEYVVPIKRDIKNQGLMLMPKRLTTYPEEVRLERDAFYEIVDRAMVFSCRKQMDEAPCEFSDGRFKDCPLYRAFTTTAAPVYDPERKNECPYRME